MTEQKTIDFFAPDAAGPAPPSPAIVERIQKQPEYRLLWAVLQDGIETYMKYAPATGRRGRRLFHEAEEWIMQNDPTWLCSFVTICHVLGFDPDYLRAGLERWRAEKVVSPTAPQPELQEAA